MKNLTFFSNFANVCLRFLRFHRAVQNRNFLFLLLLKKSWSYTLFSISSHRLNLKPFDTLDNRVPCDMWGFLFNPHKTPLQIRENKTYGSSSFIVQITCQPQKLKVDEKDLCEAKKSVPSHSRTFVAVDIRYLTYLDVSNALGLTVFSENKVGWGWIFWLAF